ncbi:MAG: hypothetical protein MJ241_02640 [Bacilli bacterium]|nr:hypothetical protein [Bacilli bacterium]
MENRTNTAVIEITDTAVKFAVGYCINKKPVVVYTKTEPLPEGAVSQGRIVNDAQVKEIVSKFLNIEDESVRRKVNDITAVVIPPNGFRNLFSDRNTLGSDPNGIICPQDLSNIINQSLKLQIPDGSALVEVTPFKFLVDGKNVPFEKLYGTRGRELFAKLCLHTVSVATLNEQKVTIQQSGFRTDRTSVAPYCAASLISSDGDTPRNYFYADFGARMLSLTLIADSRVPYASSSFASRGGDDLTTYIANNLLIGPKEAEKLKIKYGYNDKRYSYQLPIWEGVNLNGEPIKITQDTLNRVLVNFFNEFNQYFANSIKTLCHRKDKPDIDPREFVLYVSGGASKLKGLEKLIAPLKNIIKDIVIYVPKVPGARDPAFINLLGLIVINGDSKEHTDGSFRGMSTLIRQ